MDKTKAAIEQIMAKQSEMNTEFQSVVTKGNKAAARRARKLSNELSALLKEFRKVSNEEL